MRELEQKSVQLFSGRLLAAGLLVVFLVGCGGSERLPSELVLEIKKIESLEELQSDMEKQVLSESLSVVRKYADKGHPVAMYYMAEGRLLPSDDKNFVALDKAIDWLKKSADKGHTEACFSLAEIYATEKTVQNYELAYHWFYIGYYRKDGKVAEFKPEAGPQTDDFRNESLVASVIENLDKKQIPQLDTKAKEWIAKHPKK
jgi:hypothetical protein